MRSALASRLLVALLALGIVPLGHADDPGPAGPRAVDAGSEALALGFVREHHPELASVVEALRPKNPAEYAKAIGELSGVARSLALTRERNPKRYAVALAAWKAQSRVELGAARLASEPTEERLSELRLAIEAKVDTDVARQRFELEQAEAAAKKARAALDRLETHRDEVVEARLRALRPRKNPAKIKAKPKSKTEAAVTPEGNRR